MSPEDVGFVNGSAYVLLDHGMKTGTASRVRRFRLRPMDGWPMLKGYSSDASRRSEQSMDFSISSNRMKVEVASW
ncbi:MAG: hypothetical protein CMN75_12780 [Spirochaeta sp.]|nr:hypothetical protein [Spirochaeta sp.]